MSSEGSTVIAEGADLERNVAKQKASRVERFLDFTWCWIALKLDMVELDPDVKIRTSMTSSMY